jgi:VHL beta domain
LNLFKAIAVSVAILLPASGAWAQAEEKLYSSVRGWNVVATGENGTFVGCGMIRPQDRFAMVLLQSSSYSWELGFTTTAPAGRNVTIDMDIDRASDVMLGVSNGTFAGGQIHQGWVDALASGKRLSVQMDGYSTDVSLRGTTAAILKVTECVDRYNVAGTFYANLSGTSQESGQAIPQPQAPRVIAPMEDDTARMGEGCPVYGSYRSPNSQDWAGVEFVNLTDRAITVYWIDYDGRNVDMAGLAPNESIGFDSYAGHYWIAKDFGAKCYGGLMMAQTDRQSRYEIR